MPLQTPKTSCSRIPPSHPALRRSRGPRRGLRVAALAGAWTLAAMLGLEQAHAVPFYVHDVREICQLPRAGNAGRVLGHDSGSSVLFNGKVYWFFADTEWDANNNGAHDKEGGDGFINTGTAAVTDDLDASDCMDLTYPGAPVQRFFPLTAKASYEKYLWPIGSVVANGQIYVYSSAVSDRCQSGSWRGQTCNPGSSAACGNNPADCVQSYQTFLAKAQTDPLVGERLAISWPVLQEPSFLSPFKFSEPTGCGAAIWVALVGTKTIWVGTPPYRFPLTQYFLARVTQANIEDTTKYQYLNVTTQQWVKDDPSAATPIFEEYFGGQPSVSYNTHLGRWMMTYAGDAGSSVLARTALQGGKTSAALMGGWSEKVKVYDCPGGGLSCYFPYQHPEYGDGSTIYVTTSRNTPARVACTTDAHCLCRDTNHSIGSTCVSGYCTTPGQQRKYRMRLREVTIGTSPPPNGRQLVDAARDFDPNPRCEQPIGQGGDGWSYRRWNGTTYADLGFSWDQNWSGTENVGGVLAPNIEEDVMLPGENADAVRIWQVPDDGTVRVSGEVRMRYNCGHDGVRVDWIRIRNSLTSQLHTETLSSFVRDALYDKQWTVQAGDKLGFRVHSLGSAVCDDVDFAPTITFTPNP